MKRPQLYLDWNPKQAAFLECEEPFQNLEGGVRAGKSYVLCWKVLQYCVRFPGICIALTRYTQDGLDAMLRPVWRDVCRRANLNPVWKSDEECDVLPNGSRVYLRALKSSDDQRRYSKLAGLTLAILAIDQAEELPEDIYRHYVPARLSQPGFPKAVWITPNPPMPNSWIAREWPPDHNKPGHVLIRTTMFDNVDVLGKDYIDLQLQAYEPGTLEYRRLVQGERGLIVAGTPIYARHFREQRHVDHQLQADPLLPLYESVDFGTRHPCVVWSQFPNGGRLHILGGVMGSDLALEEFLPLVAEIRAEWFGEPLVLQWTCDPAGETANSHGSKTGVQILRDFGIYPVIHSNANYPPVRAFAIQTVIGYLKRTTADGDPLFRVNPRFVVVDAAGARRHEPMIEHLLAGGYCYDPKKTYAGTNYPHLVPPLKDQYFEHPANCIEYGVVAFAPPDPANAAGVVRNPESKKRAERVLRERGFAVSNASLATMQSAIVQARYERDQERAIRRALRFSQRDDRDRDVWKDQTARIGRGGYN